jgi:hypothetical protein
MSIARKLMTQGFATVTPPPTGKKYIGYPTDANGVPNPPAGNFIPYGASGDRLYARLWTATEDGTLFAMNLYIRNPSLLEDGATNGVWLCVYNGDTLVGQSDEIILQPGFTPNTWLGYVPLNVVSGQSLEFSTDDAIYVTYAQNALAGDDIASSDNGEDSTVEFDNITTFDTPPPIANWQTDINPAGLAVILEYSTEGGTPPPGDAMPTLILTDNGQDDAPADTMQTFDVSAAETGVISYLASFDTADVGGRRLKSVVMDTARNIAFAAATPDDALADSPIIALDLSDPSDNTGWFISMLDAEPGSNIGYDRIAYDQTKQLLFIGNKGDARVIAIDVSDPASMTVLGDTSPSLYVESAFTLDETKDILYLGMDDELTCFDVSDPTNMAVIQNYTEEGLADPLYNYALNIDKERNLLFVSGRFNGFGYVDVSDPLAPLPFVQMFTSDDVNARNAVYDPLSKVIICNTGYLSGGNNHIYRIDVTDINAPVLVSMGLSKTPEAMAIDTAKKFVYVAFADAEEFYVFDYSGGNLVGGASFDTTMMSELVTLSAV